METPDPKISWSVELDHLQSSYYDTHQRISDIKLLHVEISGSQGSEIGARPRLHSAGVYAFSQKRARFRNHTTSQSLHRLLRLLPSSDASPFPEKISPDALDLNDRSSLSPPLSISLLYSFKSLLPLHPRLQPIHLHLLVLALGLRVLDLPLEALCFPLDEVEAALDGHDGVGALLFEEDGADELVDWGGGGEEGEFLNRRWGRVSWRGSWGREGRRGGRRGGGGLGTFCTPMFSCCWDSRRSRAETVAWRSWGSQLVWDLAEEGWGEEDGCTCLELLIGVRELLEVSLVFCHFVGGGFGTLGFECILAESRL